MIGTVTEADVRAAQAFLDGPYSELTAPAAYSDVPAGPGRENVRRLALRGAIASVMADVRTAGYLEGVQQGRREAAHVVLDALRDEGLAP